MSRLSLCLAARPRRSCTVLPGSRTSGRPLLGAGKVWGLCWGWKGFVDELQVAFQVVSHPFHVSSDLVASLDHNASKARNPVRNVQLRVHVNLDQAIDSENEA